MYMTDPDQLRQSLPYRLCVGTLVLNANNQVFVGKRRSDYGQIIEYPWQMPQGGLNEAETPIEGALRELYEETSISSVVLIEQTPDWVFYDLPDELLGAALKGKYRGQKQMWFAFKFTGFETEINVSNPGQGKFASEFSAWRWVQMHELMDLVVPFKRDVYGQIIDQFEHLV